MPKTANQLTLPGAPPEHLDHLRDIIKRTSIRDPHPDDILELQQLLVAYPDLWKFAGNLDENNRRLIVESTIDQASVRESVLYGAEQLRRALTQSTDTALEHLAIEQCVTAHILHHMLQARYLRIQAQGTGIENSIHWEKRLTESQRRYLRALESLARLRRLRLPLLQIYNLSGQSS